MRQWIDFKGFFILRPLSLSGLRAYVAGFTRLSGNNFTGRLALNRAMKDTPFLKKKPGVRLLLKPGSDIIHNQTSVEKHNLTSPLLNDNFQ
jgi:hypothetical protein